MTSNNNIQREEPPKTSAIEIAKKPWKVSEMVKMEEDKRAINCIVQDNDLKEKYDGLLIYLRRKGAIKS